MSFFHSSHCAMCGKGESKACARCKSIRYCSEECQRADWVTTHKLMCRRFSEFSSATRPSPQHRRAILFDPNKQKPKLIWLHCPWHEDEGVKFQAPECEPYLGESGSMVQIQNNLRLHRPLSDTIRLMHRDRFLLDGSRPNQCIREISNSGRVPHWRGPVIAYGTQGMGADQLKCRDLDSVDFRHTVDYFDEYSIAYSNDEVDAQQPPNNSINWGELLDGRVVNSMNEHKKTLLGVRINCLGDVELNQRPKFEPVQVPLADLISGSKDLWTSDIAGRIDLPVFTRKLPSDPKWAEEYASDGSSYHNNGEATFLHLNCNDKPGEIFGWGWVPMGWQQGSGSVLVVRQDLKGLHPWHVEALSEYCSVRVRPLFEAALEISPSDNSHDTRTAAIRSDALAKISRADFELTWKRVSERNGVGSQIMSPYEYSF